MIKYLQLILLILIYSVTFGQNNYQDVVYLKNGSIIRGIIIEQVPYKSIKIETADRSVFVYQMDEIEKLTKEIIPNKSNDSFNKNGIQSGYKGNIELGYQKGIGDIKIDRLKLNIINSYQINPYFSMGVGTGIRYFHDIETTLLPIFADFRVYFIDNFVTPYLSLGLGYSFNIDNNFDDEGFLLNSTLGVSIKITEKSAINVGLGYEIQRSIFYSRDFDWSYGGYEEYYENLGAINLSVGISF